MAEKKIPLRRCIGCGQMFPKKELIRVIKTPEDNVMLDPTGRKNGRGAYVCKKAECLDKAFKTKSLERSLEIKIPDGIFDEMKKEMTLLG